MSGTLELLCGPSGVGKTTSIEGVVKSYRWTTRDIREGEIDSREYDGSKSTHGFFVTEEDFRKRKEKRELVGLHRYPDPENGKWYGFPVQEIREALERGEQLSEQIVTAENIDELVNTYIEWGDVRKILFLASFSEIKQRLFQRSKSRDDFIRRTETAKDSIKRYLDIVDDFDEVRYSFPRLLGHEDSLAKIDEMIEKVKMNKGFVIEHDLGSTFHNILIRNYGQYLDILIGLNRLEAYMDGDEVKRIIQPEYQFNLKYDDDVDIPRDLDPNSEECKIIQKGLIEIMESMAPVKESLIRTLEDMAKIPELRLREVYHSAFQTELNPLLNFTINLDVRGLGSIAAVPNILKLHNDVYGWEIDRENTLNFRGHFTSIQETGEPNGEDYMERTIRRVFLQPLEETEGLKKRILSDESIIRNYPRDISRATLDCFDWSNPEKASEHSLSYASLDLRYALRLLGIMFDITVGDDIIEIPRRDFIPAAYYIIFQDEELFKMQCAAIERTGFKLYGNKYAGTLAEHKRMRKELYGEQVQVLDGIRLLGDMIKEYEEREAVSKRGLVIVDNSKLASDINELVEILTPKKQMFETIANDSSVCYISQLADMGQTMDAILHMYTAFNDDAELREFVEIRTVSYIAGLSKVLMEDQFKHDIFNTWVFRHLFAMNLEYMETIVRIMQSDRNKPNSRENLWSYPLRATPREFFSEYFRHRFPSVEESYENMQEHIDWIDKSSDNKI